MTTPDDYIRRVIDQMPRPTPLRSQIAIELRGDISERLARGQSMDDVLQQLGDPVALAESYLAEVPLVRVSFWRRVAAKLIDVAGVIVAVTPFAWLVWIGGFSSHEGMLVSAVTAVLLLPVYTVVAEYSAGCTLGKWVLGLRVVRESGARISMGQSIVRQLPFVGQIFFIDVLFALFTDKNQRAFELASKTRVVRVEEQEAS
jgi:uncharacterized RDD family membrane protein YckC